jgi:hypothetical protein
MYGALGGGCGARVGARRGYARGRLEQLGEARVGAAVGEACERGSGRCALFGQYHRRLDIGWVLWGFRRGILRRRHERLGRCARGVLDARGSSEAVGMYPDCSVLDLAAVRLSFNQPAVCSCASVTMLGGA